MGGKFKKPRELHGVWSRKDNQTPKEIRHLYFNWYRMRMRCDPNPSKAMIKHHNWKNYGGRGIRVCDEWWNSFSAFLDWALSHGYRIGLTIDRIDRNKGYCPENCQWLTRSENTRKANYYRWHIKPFEKGV